MCGIGKRTLMMSLSLEVSIFPLLSPPPLSSFINHQAERQHLYGKQAIHVNSAKTVQKQQKKQYEQFKLQKKKEKIKTAQQQYQNSTKNR
jgi:hypothetical protein